MCLCVSHLVCRDEVDEDGIQQLLCDAVSLHDDGAHQVHHVHLHLLVVAVTVETERERDGDIMISSVTWRKNYKYKEWLFIVLSSTQG